MDQPNPTFAKILILDTEKFEQWKFRIQQYLKNEHYALWEVIEFSDSYKAPQEEAASESSTKKKGMTIVITTEDMQKRRNDVKARTTLLLALHDEHQLRFSKLQAIDSHLEFINIEIGQNDLNQKFLTSLAPEWLMYTIVWRNGDDLDTMSLDDIYNHLKVYEPEVQKKSESNSKNMAFISLANTSSGKGEVHTASVPTASTQIKYEYITQIDEDDIKEIDIKWNMALLIPPPPAQVYSPPKKDLSWTSLPEFVDDTVTDYSRPTPSINTSNSVISDLQSNNSSVSELEESSGSIMSKPMIKQVNTARPKAVINAVRTNWVNYVKASTSWVWKPIKPNSASITLKRYDSVDKRRNNVKARTTLPLALHDEHQLRFNKYETAQELWGAILKTFSGNEATKKTKKNQLKQQYGNFKAEGLETLEQTFNRLQAIRNRDDLDTMSLDDVYNHLKVYEPEVQKKLESNSQNMAFISSANTSSGKGEVHTASVLTTSTQIKYEDITQIDEDDIEEMDINQRWSASITTRWAILLGSAEHQGVKTESYMANEEENHALVADDKALTEFALMAKSSSSSENEIRGLERDVEVRKNKIKYLTNELEEAKKEKESLDNKLMGFENASQDLENLLGSYRLDKNKESLRYIAVPPPPAQVYSPPKKDLSRTSLPEFVDDTVTDYSRPTPSINTSNSVTSDLQSNNSSVSELGESSGSIMSKPMIKFVKAANYPRVTKTNNIENARKSTIRYTEMYRNTTTSPKLGYTCKEKRQLNDKREEKPVWINAGRVNHQNSPRITHPNLKKHMAPRKNLTRSGPISPNTAKQSYINAICCCCSRQVNTARPKAVINAVRTNWVNDVKASACWI
nr:hypothetical protein [Tanacetum cinerariifolium]